MSFKDDSNWNFKTIVDIALYLKVSKSLISKVAKSGDSLTGVNGIYCLIYAGFKVLWQRWVKFQDLWKKA